MLKLGQVINPNIVSVLNKLSSVGLNVPERVAYKNFVKAAQPALKDWQDLLTNFREKIDAKDAETVQDLHKEWNKEVDVSKFPSSVVDKLEILTPNEETALLEVCE